MFARFLSELITLIPESFLAKSPPGIPRLDYLP
jgi:hypothetical protein